jgi:hypothetical protein
MDGAPIFMVAMNAQTGRFWAQEGTAMSSKAQEAVISGTEYLWDKEALSQSAALLWRTGFDSDDVAGYSGSVLCEGKPTDAEAKAVLFQNFQGHLKSQAADADGRPVADNEYQPMYKGGFLLPQEIRESAIRVGRAGKSLEPTSLNPARQRSQTQRRAVTGP